MLIKRKAKVNPMSKKKRVPRALNARELDDFSGTLQQLREEVDKLIALHGTETIITFDAGYNNVSALLTRIEEIEDEKG